MVTNIMESGYGVNNIIVNISSGGCHFGKFKATLDDVLDMGKVVSGFVFLVFREDMLLDVFFELWVNLHNSIIMRE